MVAEVYGNKKIMHLIKAIIINILKYFRVFDRNRKLNFEIVLN